MAVCAIWAVNSANAQSAAATAGPASAPSDALEEVVVTAERRETNLMTTPVSETVLSSAQLQKANVTNLQELVHDAPGFLVNPGNSGPNDLNLQIRGIGPSGSLANVDQAVGVYVDGVYYARAGGGDLSFIDVDRAEVLKGPQGTLFGRNTIAGAISVTTNAPKDYFDAFATLGTGNYGRLDASGMVNIPLSETLDLRVVYAHEQHTGYGHDLFLNLPLQNLDQDFGRISLLWKPSSDFKLLQTIDYRDMGYRSPDYVTFYLDPAIASAANAAAVRPYLQPIGSRNNFGDVDLYAHNKTFDYTNTATLDMGWATLKSIAGYRKTNIDEPTDVDGTPNAITDYLSYPLKGHQFSEEMQLYGDALAGKLSWITGLYYFDEFVDVNSADPAKTGTVLQYTTIQDMSSISKSVFGQLSYELLAGLKLTGGARYVWDQRNASFYGANVSASGVLTCSPNNINITSGCLYTPPQLNERYVPWTAGIDYALNHDVFLYGKVSQGYRSGGEQQRYIEDPSTGTLGTATKPGTALPFPSFDTERAITYELGSKLSLLDDHFRVTTAVYLTNYDNIQTNAATFGATSGVPVLHFYNIGSAQIRGGELELVALLGNLRLTQTLGVIDPHFTSGPYLGTPYISSLIPSKYATSTGAEYPFTIFGGELNVHADFSWQSTSYSYPVFNINAPNGGAYYAPSQINAIRNPDYGLLNSRISYRLPNNHWEVQLWGKNLADKFYFAKRASNYSSGYDAGFPGDPRTYGVTVKYSYR
jgi:iron complex outermembrane receptor protein